MKKTFKLVSVAIIATMAMGVFVGCKSNTGSPSSKKSESKKIGMVISTLNNPFFVTLKDGAEAKAKELGYELLVVDSQNDSSKELSNVQDLLQKGISTLIINPVDSDAAQSSVVQANNEKIPVITVDRKSNGGDVISHIASDNVKGGEMAGNFIKEQLGGKGNIAELQGVTGASATRDRGKGFHNIVDKDYKS